MLDLLWSHPGVAAVLLAIFALVIYRLYHSSNARSGFIREFTKRQRITSNVVFRYGVVEIKGRRAYMEDRHVEVGMLNGREGDSLYAVFDGHGGPRASEFCVERVPRNLLNSRYFAEGNIEHALVDAFTRTDDEFMMQARAECLDDGTTAIAACVRNGNEIFVANAGDSRGIVVQRQGKVFAVSDDHKPNRPDEMARIKAAGGAVYFHGVWRVQGILAVSRAIGDRILKAYVTARPDVARWEVTAADKFLVLATDGLWDVMSNEEVGEVIVTLADPQEAAARLVEYAFTRGSADNITVLVVDLTSTQMAASGGAGAGAAAAAGATGSYSDDKQS
uniref:PPM-type phosphatase domain-containing protein n=1 Tax=Bicosoecida sp. CB-2014 TaxID=1486930 RepID=A0A7S1G7D5_9STRA|mmetsp:Transcript_19954/g.70590  ORF Transcript_19954/g.70590 Transcript_19954/m.70590 type:complete len:334 (+) Transcript_19954:413-1414(+)